MKRHAAKLLLILRASGGTPTPTPTPAPSWSVQPSISGTPTVGQTLTGSDGTISNGTVSARAWLRAGTPIGGATGSTYLLDVLDEGELISFDVEATGAGGTDNATSAAVGPIDPEPEFVAPTLTVTDDATNPPEFSIDTGDAVVGDTFRLIWDDNSGFTTPEDYDHVFTSDDALNGNIDWETLAGFGPFTEDTTIYWKLEVYRSAALIATSNTVSATILDVTPSAFSFTDVTEATVSTSYESNEITVAGLSTGASVAVTVTGGEYQKNGGSWVSTAGTASNGDDFKVRATSSGSGATAVNVVLTIGGVSDTFTITTGGAGIVATPSAAEPMINIVFAADNYTFEDVDFLAGLAVVTVVSSHRRISGMTIGGNTATLVSQSQTADSSPHASVWQYDGITAGNHDIVLTGPGGLAIMAIQSVTLVGADPTPYDTAVKPEGAGSDPQVTTTALDVVAGGYGICGVYGDTAGADPTWNTGTELCDIVGDRRFTAAYFTANATPSVSGLGFGTAMAAASWEPA